MGLVNDYGPQPGDAGYHSGAPGAMGIAWGINTSDGAVSLDDEFGGRGGGSDGKGSGSGSGSVETCLSNEFTTALLQSYVDELLSCAGDPGNIRQWGNSAAAYFGCTSAFDCASGDPNCRMCASGGSAGSRGGEGLAENIGLGSTRDGGNNAPWGAKDSPEGETESPAAAPTPTPAPKPPSQPPSQARPAPSEKPLQWQQTWGNGWTYEQGSFVGGGRPTNYSLTYGNGWFVYNKWNDVTSQQSTWGNWAIVNPSQPKNTGPRKTGSMF